MDKVLKKFISVKKNMVSKLSSDKSKSTEPKIFSMKVKKYLDFGLISYYQCRQSNKNRRTKVGYSWATERENKYIKAFTGFRDLR